MNRAARRAAKSQMRRRLSWDWQERNPRDHGLERFPALARIRTAFVNDLYIVQVFDVATQLGDVVHLAIKAVDGHSEPPWRDMQRIKNELCGHDYEAVQVCPKQSDVMDQADMYHLFVLPKEWPIPFGLHRESGFVSRGATL